MTGRALAACFLLGLAGCGGSAGTEASAPTGPPAVEQFGFIRDVDSRARPRTLVFDKAEWLEGEQAQKEAVKDGVVPPGEPVPNDYYMRNTIRDERTLAIAPDTEITADRCQLCRGGQPGNLDDFLGAFRGPGRGGGRTYNDPYRGSSGLYWVTIQGKRVVAIDEQYRP